MNIIERVYSKVTPPSVERGDRQGHNLYDVRINFNVQTLVEPDEQGNTIMYDTMQIKQSQHSYGGIVSALIEAKYSSDEMWAIINNYLLNPTDPEIKGEFDTMQAWRVQAKAFAKSILNIEYLKGEDYDEEIG